MLEDACKEMGLSDEAAEQITTAYGKQAEEKINKVNSMVEFVAKQVKIEREKFYQEHGEPAYRVGSSPARNTTGKDSVEVNKESNSDIYKMFANLDVSSKENGQLRFKDGVTKTKVLVHATIEHVDKNGDVQLSFYLSSKAECEGAQEVIDLKTEVVENE